MIVTWLYAKILRLRTWIGGPLIWIERRPAPPQVKTAALPEPLAGELDAAIARSEVEALAHLDRALARLGQHMEADGGRLINVVVSQGWRRPSPTID